MLKKNIRFYCLSISILLVSGLSACAGSEAAGNQTILPTQPNVNALPGPIASAINTNSIPPTAISTWGRLLSQFPVTDAGSDPYPIPFINLLIRYASRGCCNGAGQLFRLQGQTDGMPLGGVACS
jgi:hypothetical protein